MNFILIFFAFGFLGALVVGGVAGRIPPAPAFLYGMLSAATFILYAWDKHRARGSQRRTAEKTLHLFELLGGWPGALIAQRVLRHKNKKWAYQRTFWLIVGLHLAGWIWLIARL